MSSQWEFSDKEKPDQLDDKETQRQARNATSSHQNQETTEQSHKTDTKNPDTKRVLIPGSCYQMPGFVKTTY